MQTYFQNNFVSIYYDKEARLGKARWRGHLQGPELREAFLLCLELIDRYTLVRWLADDRYMSSIDPADLEWSIKVFVPRVADSSLLRMARIPSFSEENRESVEVMIDKGKNYVVDLVHRNFTDEQEAMDWLMQPL